MRKTFGRVRSSSSDSQHPATPLLDRYKDISDNGIVVNFTVNGDDIHYDGPDMRLLPFLRNNLRLTGVKDGCSEGACGACTVIIDGKATKSCVVSLSRLEGKHITTIEGLSEREKRVRVLLCRIRRRPVRLLHPGDDHVHQGTYRHEPRSYGD